MGKAISYDARTGRFAGGAIVERLGMHLLCLGARLTGPFQFYGYSYGAKLVRSLLPGTSLIHADMEPGFSFCFPYGDGYWGRLLDPKQPYSRDVQDFMRAVKDCDHAFIDCGANFGYFSACASSEAYGSCPTIGIEADAANFELLVINQENCGARFETRHNAIYRESGIDVGVFGLKHEAFSIVENGTESRGTVKTLSIGSLSDWVSEHGKSKVIIKLDVEGAEVDAIDGIGDMGGADWMLIYEDHGSELNHDVSRHLKDNHGCSLFYFSSGKMQEILDYSTLDAIKTNRRFGYDLLATKSPFWLEEIKGMIQ